MLRPSFPIGVSTGGTISFPLSIVALSFIVLFPPNAVSNKCVFLYTALMIPVLSIIRCVSINILLNITIGFIFTF